MTSNIPRIQYMGLLATPGVDQINAAFVILYDWSIAGNWKTEIDALEEMIHQEML